jgi:aspartate 1-decarboxylase
MLSHFLKAKIHGATITQAELNYMGSLTLDIDLMEKAGMREYEQVQVVNRNTGSRIITYLIAGARGTGVCCLNGPAARSGAKGDIVVIMTFALVDLHDKTPWVPVKVFLDTENKPKEE